MARSSKANDNTINKQTWADEVEEDMKDKPVKNLSSDASVNDKIRDSGDLGLQVTAITDAVHQGLNFTICDQDWNEWFIPRSRINLKIDGIGSDGQLKFSGTVPLEYSWYPLPIEQQAGIEVSQIMTDAPAVAAPLSKVSDVSGAQTLPKMDRALRESDPNKAAKGQALEMNVLEFKLDALPIMLLA